ncbi:type II/IV secretion system ATPase subunit [Methanogenium sp. S4BF]|uniref:type II/IV secretion system ATPase subunit n=1 Tax=Methanogenium sp. S4BF TaxID=1789226 RepID=UPI00241698AA|nr:type II/IV secretion system ATPase subunit [Methanogenium sp. S4BF]WFN34759.1 type II/IV secretion system ATPase subunit [Methanogenium sp. S4BF]
MIPEAGEEKSDDTTSTGDTGIFTPQMENDTEIPEFQVENTPDDYSGDDKNEPESPSHLNSLIRSLRNETPEDIPDEIPTVMEEAKSSHLDSLIADIQENTTFSVGEDSSGKPDSESEKKIDGIISELLNKKEEYPEADYFGGEPDESKAGELSSIIQEIQNSETAGTERKPQRRPDDIINELVNVYDEAEPAPGINQPQNSTTRITRIIEEISSEGNKNIRKEQLEIRPETRDSHSELTGRRKIRRDGIISAEEAANFSDQILSGGAELDLEEFHVSARAHNFEMSNRKEIFAALDGIAEGDLERLDLSKLKPVEYVPEEDTAREQKKKRFGQGIFGKIMGRVVEYDPAIHGSLVDLSHDSGEGIEEIELYPVNEPYAYIRIIFDHNTHEYLYTVIEPELSEGENVLLQELTQRLFETLDISTKDLTKERARATLTEAVDLIIFDYGIKLDPVSREKILYHIQKNFIGDGRIDAIMHDKYIEDISCDGINAPIFVFHSNYESIQTNLTYTRPDDLDSFVTKLAQRAGKYISIAEPMLDATMADGSRIQMTLGHEVTAHGSTFTIRKFKDEPITPTDLIEWGTYSPLSIAFLWLAVENGKSCIFAGGTASGKTTSLNAISLFIPPLAKIVTLEDTRELKLPHKNWIPSITRESFDSGGKGSIDMYELLRAALRQRPEYILVGEVRGKEAQTLFQAMSTGHVTYATTHADSVASVVHRFENPPMDVPRNMLSALDLVSVQVQARFGGQRIRRNKTLIEILDIDPRTNELITNEVFKWNAATDEIRFSGKSYILEDIMEGKGWSDTRMREELKRRQEILEWMRLKKIRHFQEVGKVLLSYYRNPETVMELVRSDLYE